MSGFGSIPPSVGSRRGEDEEVHVFDVARVVWHYRWMIFAICAVAIVVAFAITIRTPKVYESTATVLAPREGGGNLLGGIVAATGVLQQIPGYSVPSLTPNRDLLLSVLQSRTVAQAIIERFRLQQRYRAVYMQDAIRGLRSASNMSASKEGVLVIKVEDEDPRLAAEIANFYVELLDRLVAQYGTGEAGRQAGFLTAQLARAKSDLEFTEEALRRFQERNRAIVLQEQTRGAIEAAARLKGEIMAAEVQLQVIRNFATDSNPEVVALRRRLDEMNRQLAKMQYGDGVARQPTASERQDFAVPFSKVPEVGLDLARLTRDVKVQETLVMLLTQQVEQARIAAARDTPVVQVLDRAVPAERHAKPKLGLNLLLTGLTSFFGAVLLAFLLEFFRSLRRTTRDPRPPAATQS